MSTELPRLIIALAPVAFSNAAIWQDLVSSANDPPKVPITSSSAAWTWLTAPIAAQKAIVEIMELRFENMTFPQ